MKKNRSVNVPARTLPTCGRTDEVSRPGGSTACARWVCYTVPPAPPSVPALLRAPTNTLRLCFPFGTLPTPASSPGLPWFSVRRRHWSRRPRPASALPHSPRITFVNTNVIHCCPEGGGRSNRPRKAATSRRKSTGLHLTEAKTGESSPKRRDQHLDVVIFLRKELRSAKSRCHLCTKCS